MKYLSSIKAKYRPVIVLENAYGAIDQTPSHPLSRGGAVPSWCWHNCLINPNGEAWRNEWLRGSLVAGNRFLSSDIRCLQRQVEQSILAGLSQNKFSWLLTSATVEHLIFCRFRPTQMSFPLLLSDSYESSVGDQNSNRRQTILVRYGYYC